MMSVYVVMASTTLRSALKACCAGCSVGAMASLMRVAIMVSTSLKDTSKREIGLTSSLLVGCMMGPTPLVFSRSHTLNFLVNIGVFFFVIHWLTKGSRYCVCAVSDANQFQFQ